MVILFTSRIGRSLRTKGEVGVETSTVSRRGVEQRVQTGKGRDWGRRVLVLTSVEEPGSGVCRSGWTTTSVGLYCDR